MKWREVSNDPLFNLECYLDLQDKKIEELKKENEILKAKLEIGKICGFCPYYHYKSRCEKAIEYINNNKLYDYDKEELFEIVSDKIAKEYLLNILQGSDEE